MFKSVPWKSEKNKNKIKAVFKLQFHATQVPQLGGDALVVSIIPADVGKPTVKLHKATIRDGNCYWDDPVYETVKFVQDSKSGKIHEKIYHFVVGSSKARFVGEASVDMSVYVSATKISFVSLPLKNSKSDILLQVSIQRMLDSVDQRAAEESETTKLSSQNRSLRMQMSNNDMEKSTRIAPVEDIQLNESTHPSDKMNEKEGRASTSDVTMSSSNSSEGFDTHHALQIKSDNVHQDTSSLFSSMTHDAMLQPISDATKAVCDKRDKSWEVLALESSPDASSGTSTVDSLRGNTQGMEDLVIEKLKRDLIDLSRQAEIADLELLSLRRQIAKENRRGNDLSVEINKLKEERDILKEECQKLKSFPRHMNDATSGNKMPLGGGDRQALVAELVQELEYEKDLNSNLKIRLQKTQESNNELLLAVRDLDDMLDQKDKEIANLSDSSSSRLERLQGENFKCKTDIGNEEQKALDEVIMEHPEAKDIYMLEEKIMELQNEMETYRKEKEEVEMHMEQLALEYEILKQANHDMSYKLEQSELLEQLKMQYECSSSYAILNELQIQIESLEDELSQKNKEFSTSLNTISLLEVQVKDLEDELKKRSQEHSDSLTAIKELEDEVINLEEELEHQAQGFIADLEALTIAKVEQEQRAIKAEDSLRKILWQNSSTAGQLQEELKKLSVQIVSTFEANETLASKEINESSQLRMQKNHLEEKLSQASVSHCLVKEKYEARLDELSSQVVSMSNQIDELQLKVHDKSNQLEHEVRDAEKTQTHLEQEISLLKAQLETLAQENTALAKQSEDGNLLTSELDHMRRSYGKIECLLEKAMEENVELETLLTFVKERAEESLKELHRIMCVKNEKESIAKDLESKVDSLQVQCHELRQLWSDNESEKEKLRRQVHRLRPGSNRKDDTSNRIKKPNDSNGRVTVTDGSKTASKDKLQPVSHSKNEVATLKERINLLEGLVKQKESALQSSTGSFLEKEKELHKKLEELEQRLEVLNDCTANPSGPESNQVNEVSEGHDKIVVRSKDTKDASENLRASICINGISSSIMSNHDNSDETDLKFCARQAVKQNELLGEMALLMEKNKVMEVELKEMRERYSEISLKFAEVEGERQQLVMKLRNLKKSRLAF